MINEYTKTLYNLQKKLEKKSGLLKFNTRKNRTFLVIPGINHPKKLVTLSKTQGLRFFEERMLFFLFLLKYPNTKIIYVTSTGFNDDLFPYYVSLVSKNEIETVKNLKRLTHIEIPGKKRVSLTEKILESECNINKVKNAISDPKNTIMRCYNPTEQERELSVRLGVPLFASHHKYSEIGTKSGSKKLFQKSKVKYADGFSDIKNFSDIYRKIFLLYKKYPESERIVIKANYAASGKGNAIFNIKNFLLDNELTIENRNGFIAELINHFDDYTTYQNKDYTFSDFRKRINLSGGVVEIFVPGKIISSPSCQILITKKKDYKIVSTHNQILGGKGNQEYLGCSFPAQGTYRKLVIRNAKKIARTIANLGVMGNFAIDFLITKNKGQIEIYAIEINLRKGGTTHPFRIAQYVSESEYDKKKDILFDQKNRPIYYYSMEFLKSDNYKRICPADLIELTRNSKYNFDKTTNTGILVYMPGLISTYGKFGAISIAHSAKKAQNNYENYIKMIDRHAKRI